MSDEGGAGSAAAPKATRRRTLAQLWSLTGWSLLAGSGVLMHRTLSARPRGRIIALPPTLLEQARADGATVSGELLLRFSGEEPIALRLRCTHLGCALSFDRSGGVLRCPCHGSHFDLEGQPASGPADKPLERAPLRLRDGSWEAQLNNDDRRGA